MEESIVKYIETMISEIIIEKGIDANQIELIGIASPRNYFKWYYKKSRKS